MLQIKRIETPKTFHGMLEVSHLEISYKAGDDSIHRMLLTKAEEVQLKEYLNGQSFK
jgi:hypothetical protein